MTLFYTICSNNYLAQAIALGNSLLKHNTEYVFKIGLVDKKHARIDYSTIPFEIIEVESIGIGSFQEMFKRYSITELNTAVKPYYFQYLFKEEKQFTNYIYLDPDILVYNRFTELENELNANEIVITPHFTTPINDNKSQAENNFLNSGLYNLGFIALKRGDESKKFIDWWALRLETKSYVDFANGMFTDQLWVNFVPLFFKQVSIFRHPGYNMAYWNLHERVINAKGEVVKNDVPYELAFFHFSGFSPLNRSVLSKYQDRYSFEMRKDVEGLFNDYCSVLNNNNYSFYNEIESFYVTQKKKIDAELYLNHKKSIPIYKRIIRGIILRTIKLFRINIEYYIN